MYRTQLFKLYLLLTSVKLQLSEINLHKYEM